MYKSVLFIALRRSGTTFQIFFVRALLSDNNTRICRISSYGDYLLTRKEFRSVSCVECFYFIYANTEPAYRNRYRFVPCLDGLIVCDFSWEESCICNNTALTRYNLPHYALSREPRENYTLESLGKLFLDPPLSPGFLEVTEACCKAADECCHKMIRTRLLGKGIVNECPATWDGWNCFLSAPSNRNTTMPCPSYIYRSLTAHTLPNVHYAMKHCLAHGQWFTIFNPVKNEQTEWTDYSKCVTVDFQKTSTKLLTGIFSFLVSAMAIIPALFIFSVFRALKIESNVIHKQLLISFLLTAVFYIFNGLFFALRGAPGEHLMQTNHITCRIMFSIQLRYLRLTNYSWMLCEGWYLHRLLVAAFESNHSLVSYFFLGWGFPLIATIIYCVLRALYDDSVCWVGPTIVKPWIEWISYAPCLCCLFINFILMVSIVAILVRKLRINSEFEPVHYRKAVRAAVMLLPVFGIHFIITIYPIQFLAYELLNVLLDGLQGFFVVTIVCYTNHKVIESLKKCWNEHKEKRQITEESIIHQRTYRFSRAVERSSSLQTL